MEGFELAYDGSIRAKVLDNLSGKQLTDALLSYAQRAKKGVGDPALLAGTGKELLEATAKHVIHTKYGTHPQNANFPTLMGQAYSALQMSIPESNATPVSDNPVAEYEKAMFNMALAINRVRNKEGTGHGRISVTKLSDTESENIVQMVGVIADFLLHRLSQDS
ncbi:abortive infection family protein [Vibrio diabolicus]|nr:abortive infection family protein [Vibrio diabolicus]